MLSATLCVMRPAQCRVANRKHKPVSVCGLHLRRSGGAESTHSSLNTK